MSEVQYRLETCAPETLIRVKSASSGAGRLSS